MGRLTVVCAFAIFACLELDIESRQVGLVETMVSNSALGQCNVLIRMYLSWNGHDRSSISAVDQSLVQNVGWNEAKHT